MQKFEALVGKHQAIVGSSSFWGRGTFPNGERCASFPITARNRSCIGRRGDRPTNRASTSMPARGACAASWPGIAIRLHRQMGGGGARLRPAAAGVLRVRAEFQLVPVVRVRQRQPTRKTADGSFAGPDLYKRAFRHAVDRVRARPGRTTSRGFFTGQRRFPPRPSNGTPCLNTTPARILRGLARDERVRSDHARQRRLGGLGKRDGPVVSEPVRHRPEQARHAGRVGRGRVS